MIAHDDEVDTLLQQLTRLRPLTPDPARADRVRAQCRAQLVRAPRPERSAVIRRFARAALGPSVVGFLCVLYLVEFVDTLLGLRSLFE